MKKLAYLIFILTLVVTSFTSCKPRKASCPAYQSIQANTDKSGQLKVPRKRAYSLFPHEHERRFKKRRKHAPKRTRTPEQDGGDDIQVQQRKD